MFFGKEEVKKKAEKGLQFFLSALFPVFCVNCGKEGFYICEDCSIFLSENSLICPVCHESSYNGKRHRRCGNKHSMDGLASIWDYEGIAKKSILQLKYSDIYHMTGELIERAFSVMIRDRDRFSDFLEFVTKETTVITFVPANQRRIKIKGLTKNQLRIIPSDGNHAEVLAKKLAEFLKKEESALPLLEKTRKTKRQVDLTEDERIKNLKGAFKAKERKIPTNVVLVDDVLTTGTTMRECAKVLKRAGAKRAGAKRAGATRVWGFSLTRAV